VIVGASGEKVGLKLAAKYADFWQMSISPDSGAEYARKVEVLGNHCRDLGRDQATVKRLPEIAAILRETTEEANDAFTSYASHFKWSAESREYMDKAKFAGPAEQVAEALKPILATGIDGLIYQALPPYDFESIRRIITELRPALEAG
jgi:alkanesulfonate monooxygenase SsuD/methylene tetrahydromethanopterin reductase-like flavin-dependent oxidoreductase (luciferase family)